MEYKITNCGITIIMRKLQSSYNVQVSYPSQVEIRRCVRGDYRLLKGESTEGNEGRRGGTLSRDDVCNNWNLKFECGSSVMHDAGDESVLDTCYGL